MSTLKKSKSKTPSKPKPNTLKSSSKSSTNTIDTSTDARFEGTDPNWGYQPPPGAVLIKEDAVDAGEFDWDRICEDDELELWVVRVPDAIKPKHLENISLSLPSSSSKKSTRIGTVKRKTTTFDIWSIVDAEDEDQAGVQAVTMQPVTDARADAAQVPAGGEELKGMACLLHRKSKKGKLYPAPKPFARHIVIAAQPIQPSPSSLAPGSASTSTLGSESTPQEYKNPPRYSYPKEVLKHRYIPYGSTELLSSFGEGSAKEKETMDVDEDEDEEDKEEEAPPSAQPPLKSPKKAGKKGKKAKGEEGEVEEEKGKGSEKEKTKIKGKKRKGDVGEEEGVPAKKAKKSK